MWVDIIIVVFLAVCIYDGWKDGFLKSLTSLASWVAAVIAGVFFLDKAVSFLNGTLALDRLIQKAVSPEAAEIVVTAVDFLAIVILVKIAIELLASALKIVNRIPVLGLLNRAAGAVLGAGKFIVILWIIAALIIPYGGTKLMDACEDSRITPVICEYNPLMGII